MICLKFKKIIDSKFKKMKHLKFKKIIHSKFKKMKCLKFKKMICLKFKKIIDSKYKKIIRILKTKNLKKEKTLIHLKIKINSFQIQLNQIPTTIKNQKVRKNLKKRFQKITAT